MSDDRVATRVQQCSLKIRATFSLKIEVEKCFLAPNQNKAKSIIWEKSKFKKMLFSLKLTKKRR